MLREGGKEGGKEGREREKERRREEGERDSTCAYILKQKSHIETPPSHMTMNVIHLSSSMMPFLCFPLSASNCKLYDA